MLFFVGSDDIYIPTHIYQCNIRKSVLPKSDAQDLLQYFKESTVRETITLSVKEIMLSISIARIQFKKEMTYNFDLYIKLIFE